MLSQSYLPTAAVTLTLVGLPASVLVQCHIGSELLVVVEGDADVLPLIKIDFASDELTIESALPLDLKQETPLVVVISVPIEFTPKVSLTHVLAFISHANLDEVKLQAAGTESCLLGKVHSLDGTLNDHAALQAADVNGDAHIALSGRSKASLPKFWGALEINATERAQISVKGSFTHIDAQLLGDATVVTDGPVSGDLSVKDATDTNGFQHSGNVYGQSYGVLL